MRLSSVRSSVVPSVAKRVGVALALAIGISASAQAVEWKGWNIHVPDYPNTLGMEKFAELLA